MMVTPASCLPCSKPPGRGDKPSRDLASLAWAMVMLAATPLILGAAPASPNTAHVPPEAAQALQELATSIDERLKVSAVLDRDTALNVMAKLNDLRATWPLETMPALYRTRWCRLATPALMSLGRPHDVAAMAEAWAEALPDESFAWAAVYEAQLVLGQRGKAGQAYEEVIRTSRQIIRMPGEPNVDTKGWSDQEWNEFLQSPSQRRRRSEFAATRFTGMDLVGRQIKFLLVPAPKGAKGGKPLLRWTPTPTTGEPATPTKPKTATLPPSPVVVIAVWNSHTSVSGQVVLDAYRELHKGFGQDSRVTFLAINLLERLEDTDAEKREIEQANLPGAVHQEMPGKSPNIFGGVLGAKRFPTLIILGDDGTVRYGANPTVGIATHAAYVLRWLLDGSPSAATTSVPKVKSP